MEILTPEIPQEEPNQHAIPGELAESGLNVKNLQFMQYLGLKDELFNPTIMSKVDFLAKNLDLDSLQHLDFKVGQDPSMPRIDRIYSYLKLDLLSRDKEAELNMINQAKSKWEAKQTL